MMKMRKGEQPLVMMMKEVMPKVIVIVIAAAVAMDMVMTTATMLVRATTMKTMIANIVAMIEVNPLVIEKMKMRGFIMKSMMMM